MIEETLGTIERDKLWCLALIRTLNTAQMEKVLKEYNRLRAQNETFSKLMSEADNEQ